MPDRDDYTSLKTQNISKQSLSIGVHRVGPYAVHIAVTPLFDLHSKPMGDTAELTAICVKKKYLTADTRFSRVATMVLHGGVCLSGGYQFELTLFIQTAHKKDISPLEQLLIQQLLELNLGIPASQLKLQYKGIIYLPKDQVITISSDVSSQIIHMHHAEYFPGYEINSQHDGELTEALANGLRSNKQDKVAEWVTQMIDCYIDNMAAPKDLESLVDGDYKQQRMQLWRDEAVSLKNLEDIYREIDMSSSYLFATIKPYQPNCGQKIDWFGSVLTSIVEYVYACVGAYLIFSWQMMAVIGVAIGMTIATMRRVLKFHHWSREKAAKKIYQTNVVSDKEAEIKMRRLMNTLQARTGVSCRDWAKKHHYSIRVLYNMFMHYMNGSKTKHLWHLPEDIFIWMVYFNGIALVSENESLFLAGAFFGLVNLTLRYLLSSAEMACCKIDCEKAAIAAVALFYGLCYVTKDLIALHYTLLYSTDFINVTRNQNISNTTLAMLLSGEDPWITPYNRTFDFPLLNNWSVEQKVLLSVGIGLFDLMYYVFGQARSSNRANPPGSRRFGVTLWVNRCGRYSTIPNTFLDFLVMFPLQSGEMLLGIQMVLQVLNNTFALSPAFLLACVFVAAPIAALAVAFIMLVVNLIMSGFLGCSDVQPWLTKTDYAKFKNEDLSVALNKVAFDLMFYQEAHGLITTGPDMKNWLENQNGAEALLVKTFLQSIAVGSNWQTLRVYMTRVLPCVGITTTKEWKQFHLKLLKMTPQKLLVTQDWYHHGQERDTVPHRSMMWQKRTGNENPDALQTVRADSHRQCSQLGN